MRSLRLFRMLGCLVIAGPWLLGVADDPTDKGTVALAMGVALWAWSDALRKDVRIDRLEATLIQLRMRGKNLRKGATIEDFHDVFR